MRKINKLLRVLCVVVAVIVLFSSVSLVTTVYAATKVKLNKTKVTLYEGDSIKLKVTGTLKKVIWKSSNIAVATVSSKGVVKAKKKGSAKITATVQGKKCTCKVTVKEEQLSIDTLSDEMLAAYGWIAMEEYVHTRYGNSTNVTISKIYSGIFYNTDTIKCVTYECIWGRTKYYVSADLVMGTRTSYKGKSLIIRGLEDYSIASIGGSAFQEKEYFDMHYSNGKEIDYYAVRDLYKQYLQEENYRFVAD